MRRASLVDVILCITVTALVVFTLAPVGARVSRSALEARCQSNLYRWAAAVAKYVEDNGWCYPSSRGRAYSGGGLSNIVASVALSPPDNDPATGKPMRFTYSLNWVEALYEYVWDSAAETATDWRSCRRCPRARTTTWPIPNAQGYPYPSMTYVFNCNLVERQQVVVRDPRRLLMLREFWQTTISELRPLNNTSGTSGTRPQYPFLNGDIRSGATDEACELHGQGSYVVFADGHVHFFTLDYYPKYADITAVACWDAETQQWWNFAPGSGKAAPYLKSIAITP